MTTQLIRLYYDPETKVKIKAEWLEVAGRKEGTYHEYRETGQLHKTYTYVNGVLNGPTMILYTDNQIFYQSNYIDGELDGEYKLYHPDGTLYKLCYYSSGLLHGEYIEFDTDGIIQYRCVYRDGDRL